MITASIVLYNTESDLIWNVIRSFDPNEERRIFLVDNSSSENNEFYNIDYIEYIYNGDNIGYGAAHNIGIKKAVEIGADYHIVLNPDITFESTIIDELVAYANSNRNVVYMLPKVLYPDGELQYLCKLLPTPFDLIFRRFIPQVGIVKVMNDRYTLKNFGYNKIINPPCLSGCFMFLRVSTLRDYKIIFDERFFMYCEDFDLIRRLHRIGKTIYYPNVSIVHGHQKASYKSIKMLVEHMKSACKYFNKYGWFFDKERKILNQSSLREIFNK